MIIGWPLAWHYKYSVFSNNYFFPKKGIFWKFLLVWTFSVLGHFYAFFKIFIIFKIFTWNFLWFDVFVLNIWSLWIFFSNLISFFFNIYFFGVIFNKKELGDILLGFEEGFWVMLNLFQILFGFIRKTSPKWIIWQGSQNNTKIIAKIVK